MTQECSRCKCDDKVSSICSSEHCGHALYGPCRCSIRSALPHQEGFPCKKGSPSFRVRCEGGPRAVQRVYLFCNLCIWCSYENLCAIHQLGWSAEVAIRALYPTMVGDQTCFPVSRWAGLVYRIDMCPVRPTVIAALAFMVKLVSFAWCSIVRCCNPFTTSLLEGRGVIGLQAVVGRLSIYDWAGPRAGDQPRGSRRAGEQ